jgi:preprotein translocase subunit SecD
VDDQLLTAPFVNAPIEYGAATIEGLSFEEARVLAAQLAARDVPVPIRIIEIGELQ